jgi:hypothetical protein
MTAMRCLKRSRDWSEPPRVRAMAACVPVLNKVTPCWLLAASGGLNLL